MRLRVLLTHHGSPMFEVFRIGRKKSDPEGFEINPKSPEFSQNTKQIWKTSFAVITIWSVEIIFLVFVLFKPFNCQMELTSNSASPWYSLSVFKTGRLFKCIVYLNHFTHYNDPRYFLHYQFSIFFLIFL